MKDPVDMMKGKPEETMKAQLLDDMLKGLTMDSLKPVPRKYSKVVHPFDGYPLKYASMNGKRICLTHLVVYDNNKTITQDPSGENHSIIEDGVERIVTLETYPNRTVMDYEAGGRNVHVVFDREMILADGKKVKWAAFVPSPSVRAQLCFKIDPKNNKVIPNEDFFLFDPDQSGRLRRVMDNILKPQRRAERDARAIAGESHETLDDIVSAEGSEA